MNASVTDSAENASELTPSDSLLSWFSTVDHKRIGILYILTALVFLGVGGFEALLMRFQLVVPQNDFLSPELFNQLFTMHGTTMVFLVGMPVLVGFANYFVPLMIGARDVAFPRLNAMSYWLLPSGGLLLYYSFFTGQAPDAGWFSYAPLSTKPYNLMQGQDYWIIGLACLGVGSIATSINIFVTVLNCRCSGHERATRPAVCVDGLDDGHSHHPRDTGAERGVGNAVD